MKRAVESAMNQTYPVTEIILVDNNSTDNSFEILKKYQDAFPDKVSILTESIQGAAAARNKGLKNAYGEWIQFLDSDDEILPDKISRQMDIAGNCNAQLVIGNYNRIINGKIKKIESHPEPWIGLITSRLGITSSNLWKKEALDKLNGFDITWRTSEEYELLFRLLKHKTPLAYDHSFNTLVYMQQESVGQSMQQEKRAKILENAWQLRVEIREYLEKNDLYTVAIRRKWELFMYNMLVWNKYPNPEFYRQHQDQFSFSLPLHIKLRKWLGAEIRKNVK